VKLTEKTEGNRRMDKAAKYIEEISKEIRYLQKKSLLKLISINFSE